MQERELVRWGVLEASLTLLAVSAAGLRDSVFMTISIAVGLGAGLVSALLFALVITGSPFGILLSYLAPLPVLIAALGWNHRAGLAATVAGALATALSFRAEAGLAFAIGAGLPAWWLAYLALLGRPGPDGGTEWYPLGRLLLWGGLVAAAITLAGVLALGAGDYDAYRSILQGALETVLRQQSRTPADAPLPAPGGVPGATVIGALVGLVPLMAAAIFALVLVVNLWLAARTVAVSGRLPRPWPFIPATAVPPLGLYVLLAGLAASFLPAYGGVAGLSLAGGLLVAFALAGLALLHDASRGRPGRFALLAGAYLLVVLVGHTFLPLLALAGIADTLLDLRRRLSASGPPPPSNPT